MTLIGTLFGALAAILAWIWLGGSAAARVAAQWRSGGGEWQAEAAFVACVALAGALLPAIVGRPWPSITFGYGFVLLLLCIGCLLMTRASLVAAFAALPVALVPANLMLSGVPYAAQRAKAT